MHISKGLNCIVDKIHGPAAIWHRSLGCECSWQLYYHASVVDVGSDLIKMFFKSHDSLAVVSFYVGFEGVVKDMVDVSSDA